MYPICFYKFLTFLEFFIILTVVQNLHDIMKKIITFLMLIVFIPFAVAQEVIVSGKMDNLLPVDPLIRIGQLENGLTYYIRKNKKPEKRVEMRLVVNVGSMMEDDDQLGISHFVEHMAFNGTKNFEKNEIVSYLQSIGVQFGADLNAYTTFDETVYILPIPTDDEEILKQGLQILEDWAHNVTFSDEEIDKERGVVIEEWRLGRGADQRMRDEYFPVLFKDSRYAERLPIGKKEIIENATYETIRRYYHDWYRPDLMSVIAVGDIDVDQMEAMIKAHFSNLINPVNERPRKSYPVPDHDEFLIAIASDKEASFTIVRLNYKTDNVETKTFSDFRRDGIYQLYNGMLNERLNELKQSADPPFIFASTGFGSMVRTKSSYSSFAVVGADGIEKGLKAIITENERVRKYGFTEAELDRYKKKMLNNYDQAYKESDKTESGIYAREYIRSFLTQEPIPGIKFEYEFYKEVLPGIRLEEVNALAQQWIKDKNRVLVVTAPEKEGITLPAEADIRKMLDEADKIEIEAYHEDELATELIADLPTPGKVIATKTFDITNVTELTLSNGVKVVLKPTDFKNDEILMAASSPGGSSLYSDEDYMSASNAASIINESGVSDFSSIDLKKMLAGKTVRISPYIGSLSEGFNGNAAPKDFESMLQLIHLYFTTPRKDEDAFKSKISKDKMLYQNLMSNPQFYFQDQVQKIMSRNNPRGGGFPTAEDLDKIDFERSYAIYRDRFADASDFHFVFVGNFDIDEITPKLELYLGSLPTLNRNESWKDLGIRPPEGLVDKIIFRGTDPKSQVVINFTGEKPYDKKSNYDISSLGELLTIKLVEILREEKSGVYGVGASGRSSKRPYESYTFRISFPCAPENVDDLVLATFEEINNIRENGVSDEDLKKIKETQRRHREENLKKNRYWVNQLNAYYNHNTDLDSFYEREKLVEALTSEDIIAAVNKYLNMNEYIKVVLMPEQ